MPPLIVLEIIKLSLEIALEIIKNIPPSQHEAFWKQHEKNMAFWQNLFDKLQPKEPPSP